MQLGFVSAVLHDLPLEEVLAFAADEGFPVVELMCWPPGKADRRYAGVTHLDVSDFTPARAAEVRELLRIHGVKVSGLGYYPNPLDPDPEHRGRVADHLRKLIRAAPMIGVTVVNTFIGRDPAKSMSKSLAEVADVWAPLVKEAKAAGVRLGIEHCPMLFTEDEWPGGKNLATTPAVWRELFRTFDAISPGTVGLNFDPSHLVWQFVDCGRAVREFGRHLVHVHAKDERIDRERLYEVGALGLGWHVPKLPGLGDVNWGEFFAALTDAGYSGPVCVEVEDRAYEGSLADRQRALRQSRNFLGRYFG
ncbi:sugar phosphate isomerase/epimerase family protein [Urbifossiella limnaea]|uniref:Xylose isomerase-like TIM barrel n=1 Tax=Urbifossiella limnaea TaxID=2528023 RepID=A0A517XLK7_9BACT|nr:sugar phosphate isomerase/epimerase [Urbifossiella limnaea]QDU18395.1 Xylose isomerase-like TIM barrel [Urbifossiella limnaea]